MTRSLLDVEAIHAPTLDAADMAAAARRIAAAARLARIPGAPLDHRELEAWGKSPTIPIRASAGRRHVDPDTGATLVSLVHRMDRDWDWNSVSHHVQNHPDLADFAITEPLHPDGENDPSDESRLPFVARWLAQLALLADRASQPGARIARSLAADAAGNLVVSIATMVRQELPAALTGKAAAIIKVTGPSPYRTPRCELEAQDLEVPDVLDDAFAAALANALPLAIGMAVEREPKLAIRLDPPVLGRYRLPEKVDPLTTLRAAGSLPPYGGRIVDLEKIKAQLR